MKLTHTTPTEPGYYWFILPEDTDTYHTKTIVKLFKRNGAMFAQLGFTDIPVDMLRTDGQWSTEPVEIENG